MVLKPVMMEIRMRATVAVLTVRKRFAVTAFSTQRKVAMMVTILTVMDVTQAVYSKAVATE